MEQPDEEKNTDAIRKIKNNKALTHYQQLNFSNVMEMSLPKIYKASSLWYGGMRWCPVTGIGQLYVLYTKRVRLLCCNHRGISLLSCAYKIVSHILFKPFILYAELVRVSLDRNKFDLGKEDPPQIRYFVCEPFSKEVMNLNPKLTIFS